MGYRDFMRWDYCVKRNDWRKTGRLELSSRTCRHALQAPLLSRVTLMSTVPSITGESKYGRMFSGQTNAANSVRSSREFRFPFDFLLRCSHHRHRHRIRLLHRLRHARSFHCKSFNDSILFILLEPLQINRRTTNQESHTHRINSRNWREGKVGKTELQSSRSRRKSWLRRTRSWSWTWWLSNWSAYSARLDCWSSCSQSEEASWFWQRRRANWNSKGFSQWKSANSHYNFESKLSWLAAGSVADYSLGCLAASSATHSV